MRLYKQLFLSIFITIFLISVMGIPTSAEADGAFEYTLDNNNATITGYTGTSVNVIIPDTVGDNSPVAAIGDEAFKNMPSITSITVPNSVNTIGNNAFEGCNENLEIICPDWNVPVMEYALANNIACIADNVKISKDGIMTTVGSGMYYNGTGDHLTIPNGVVEIGGSNVFYMAMFKTVTIPNTVRSINYGAFYDSSLETVTIPSGVITIANDAFGYCASLTEISIPDTVTSIGTSAFRNCPSLSTINIGANNTEFSAQGGMLLDKAGSGLLQYPGASGLFTIPEGITRIGKDCFYSSRIITDVIIPEGVTIIEYAAFSQAINLKSVYLSKTVGSLVSSKFYGNSSLSDIIIANDIIGIDENSFNNCNSITNVWCNENSTAATFFGSKAIRPLTITDIPASGKLGINETVDLDVLVDAAFSNLAVYVDSPITWSSSNADVAIVNSDTGEVSGIASGTVTITASREDGLKTTAALEIYEKPTITGIVADTGHFDNDGITNDTSLEIIGTVKPNTHLELYIANVATTITTLSNASGNYTLELNAGNDLLNKTLSLTVVVDNDVSNPFMLTIDIIKPTNYSYEVDQDIINSLNDDNISFTLTGAEPESICYYTISDEDDATNDISGYVPVTSHDMTVSGLDVSQLSDGELIFDVALKDIAGNMGESVINRVDKDAALPTASILTYVNNPTYIESIPITITFREDVTDLSISDIDIVNGFAQNFNGSKKNYTFEVVPSDPSIESTITVNISEGVCYDQAGNPNSEAAEFNISYIPNEEPYVSTPISNINNSEVDQQMSIDLSEHFTDGDDDTISYSYVCYFENNECEPLGELDGTVWTFTPNNTHLNKTYSITFRGTDNKALLPAEESLEVTIIEKVNLSITKTDVTSHGRKDGSITATATKGSGIYEYSKDDGVTWQDNPIFSDLAAGNYLIKARDKSNTANVSITEVITITQPSPVYSGGSSSGNSDKPEEHPVDKAIKEGKKNAEGKLVGSIDIDKPNKNGAYEQEIPKEFFKEGDKMLEVSTPDGTVALPDDMFDGSLDGDVSISIEQVSSDVLPGVLKTIFEGKPIIDINLSIDGEKTKWESEDKEITITIPYTLTESEKMNPHRIIAVFIDDSGNIIPITSSDYDPELGAIVFRTNHTSHYSLQYVDKHFDDIAQYPWAKEAIEALAARGVINGVAKTRFAPGDSITRADFVVLITRFLGLSSSSISNFDDVMEGQYYTQAIATAKELGIITGTGDNKFQPMASISRQDMLVILDRALDITGYKEKFLTNGDRALEDYLDSDHVSDYARSSMEFFIQQGIVNGNGTHINPKGYTIRAEVAAILYKILNLLS